MEGDKDQGGDPALLQGFMHGSFSTAIRDWLDW